MTELEVGATNFFEQTLCGLADVVYRMSYGLTLNQEGSVAYVDATYKNVISKLSELINLPTSQIEIRLLEECWQLWQDDSKSYAIDQKPIAQVLSKLSVESRISLVLIEGLGLSCEEAGGVIQHSALEVRKYLGQARKVILEFVDSE
ncbi:MAG: hypothetical protein CMP10_13040 [Zetaproteobacteria bacterium]|nr:hypothetical protein [Pseudobdellovibrionaceae bacterium]